VNVASQPLVGFLKKATRGMPFFPEHGGAMLDLEKKS
jgi:hypothetical protein